MPQTKTQVLKIDKLSKDFGYRQVLKGVDMDLAAGELTLLLGKNGAGKSTLMKIISGLVLPSGGKISFKGQDTKKNPQNLRKSLGMISHQTMFYGDLTAEENLLFFSKLKKVSSPREKIEGALHRTGLRKFAQIPVKTFSSGMNKRLNIAKLMVMDPELLLLDEPYTGLDYDSIEFFNDYLAEFKKKGGTVLLITHQIDISFELCDKIAIMQNGVAASHMKTASYTYDDLIEEYQKR
ncbi:MAG: heme ABC exporter ATP-binding protein CcmA [Deltaproteobacteria bacterium]|nr:heme ABC exporter ATP-binding protein CcmA [Deltaproteobacteria bacterium]